MKDLICSTVIRSLVAVIIGGLIGSERARHGRAAGMRTHILVCLGACMTSMTSMYLPCWAAAVMFSGSRHRWFPASAFWGPE